MLQIQLTPAAVKKLWCIYTLTDPVTNEIVYIGKSEMLQLFQFADVWRMAGFDPDKSYLVTITHSATDRNDADKKLGNSLAAMAPKKPLINRYSSFADRRPEVVCFETGERFKSATECAKMEGISYSNLMNHLACKKGFKSVKGRRYDYDRQPAAIPAPRTFPV